MLSAVECLAKADALDAVAVQCRNEADCFAYAEAAETWRRIAIMARQQDAWFALNPEQNSG